MKLTKKHQKALRFKGKLEKPQKEERPAKRPKDSSGDAADNGAVDGDAQVKQKPAGGEAGRGNKEKPLSRRKKEQLEKDMSTAAKTSRFITFVGNLPFKTTADELRTYLKPANPISVRLMTNRETGKSRGFAFVEFSTAEDLRHGLRFHHTKLGDKKINVELTAGGGGNSENRQQKIKRRREELEKERSKENAAKRQKGDDDDAGSGAEDEASGSNDAGDAGDDDGGDAGSDNGKEEDTKGAKKANRRKRGRGSRK